MQTWTGTDGDEGNGSLTGGLLDYSACVPSFQSPTAPGTYPAYGAHLGPFRYYPYVNNDKVYSCPTLLALNTPKAFYVDNPAPMLLYSHYRQNPYFGHQGYGAGNLTEYPGLGDGQENIPYLNKYRIKAAITDVTQPANSVLDYEASQYDSLHDFQQPWLATPATVAFNNAYQGGDRRLVGSYTASSGNLSYYVPNIGFHHTDAGNFSYLDGHVGSLNYKAVLTDTNDTIFLLRK